MLRMNLIIIIKSIKGIIVINVFKNKRESDIQEIDFKVIIFIF